MKKACIFLLVLLVLLRLLYPHTRFGFQNKWTLSVQPHLNVESATLKPGETIAVTLVGTKKAARYSTSDFRIASVTPFGTVCAIRPGTAVITVRQGDGVYKCKITVTK